MEKMDLEKENCENCLSNVTQMIKHFHNHDFSRACK